MDNILTWFCDRSNVTFVIALAGFLMSLYNFFRSIWDRRCDFKIEYINHRCTLEHDGHTQFVLRLNFRNLTSAPLGIVRMFMVYNDSTYEFVFPAQKVWEFTATHKNTVTENKEILSQPMPFNVPGHGVYGAYFVAYLPESLKPELEKPCDFKIVVQAKSKKKSFSIFANKPNADLNEYGFFPVTCAT